MAVKIQYVVEHKGVTHLTTADKKAADQYDKMLDTADNLAELIVASGISIDEKSLEDLSIYLAKNKEAAAAVLRGKAFADVKDTLDSPAT